MLKLPKGLKKKKKGKKSKRKGEEELFTEEELEKYRREHQHTEGCEGTVKENEEWSKFKDLTTGIDSVLKKTQGDLDRIKSTSFFQRVPTGTKQVERPREETLGRPIVEVTAADFPHLVQAAEDDGDKSDYGVTDDESDDEYQDDIFDTSYVEAVERGEVKLAYVPDSPEQDLNDDIFDTSHVDALIRGQESRSFKGKKTLDIGVAVEVLTGRIDNVTVTTKKPKRSIPGDLLLEDTGKDVVVTTLAATEEPTEKSILDTDADIPVTTPIDLSVSLHTSLIRSHIKADGDNPNDLTTEKKQNSEDEFDEFTLLATESLEVNTKITRLDKEEIKLEAVVQDSWSAFEADKNESVFAECIVEDQIDIVDPYFDLDDPFDTSFADALVPTSKPKELCKEAIILEDDDDFDPRAEEFSVRLNNRRKSSVRIQLINPSGVRESITSDDIQGDQEEERISCDLLGGSTTDLTQLEDSLLNPINVKDSEVDPFDTTIVDKIAAPGKIELKFLEQELFEDSSSIFRVPSDPDFDPRADEPKTNERRASRPENLTVNKTVAFDVNTESNLDLDVKPKIVKPLTPYYTRELSITENINEELEAADTVPESLIRTRSDEDLTSKTNYPIKRRHSDYSQLSHAKVNFKPNNLYTGDNNISTKVLTPVIPESSDIVSILENDPFDTSYASVAPSKTELKLLAKEFSCEDTSNSESNNTYDFLEPSDDIFQVKALSPEPSQSGKSSEKAFDPFDTSFTADLNLGKTELKLLESEFLN